MTDQQTTDPEAVMDLPPGRLSYDARTALAAEHARLKADADVIQSRLGLLRDLLVADGGGPAGSLIVTVEQNRRVDDAAVRDAYPVAEHGHLYRVVPDPAALRRHLAPVDLDAVYRTVGARLTVTPAS